MVRMATMANLQAFHSQQKLRNNDREVFKALCKLIADSVVDHITQEPIWSPSNIESIARSNVSRFNRMAEAVYDRNDIKKMPAMIEDAEKN